jgi:hypothetical protein
LVDRSIYVARYGSGRYSEAVRADLELKERGEAEKVGQRLGMAVNKKKMTIGVMP